MQDPGPAFVELKARRTHARRSCEVCKLRKTRCELPDLSVPTSPTPLSEDKACHRCRVLTLPCIVNDTARAASKKRKDSMAPAGGADAELGSTADGTGGGESSGHNTPRMAGASSGRGTGEKRAPRRSAVAVASNGARSAGGAKGNEVDHDLDVLHSLHPSLLWTDGVDTSGSVGADGMGYGATIPHLHTDDPFFHSPRSIPERALENSAQHSLKLHGRPLELVSAMLRTAYAKSYAQSGRSEVVYEQTDWDALLDPSMRKQLQDMGYAQLRTFHPYLDPFHAQFDRLGTSASCSDQLLLSLIIYLCTFPLPPSSAVTHIRAHLRPKIAYLRDRVLLTAPQGFSTIQALDLLCVHAPLGVVPLQLADLSCLTLARGQVACLTSTSQTLGFRRLFNTLLALSRGHAFITSDAWLYIAVAADELSSALEDEVPKQPATLMDVRPLTAEWMEEGNEHVWTDAQKVLEPAELVGRLALCDRVNKIAEVIDALERLRGIMDSVAGDVTFNAVDAIQAELSGFEANMERCDARHAAVLALISPQSQLIESGHLTHRSIRRRYEHLKVLGVAIRCLTMLSFLPGHQDSMPDLPTNILPHHWIKYAADRAHTPSDIMSSVSRNVPSARLIWRIGPQRMALAAELLNDFGNLDSRVIPQPRPELGMARGDMVPMHELFAIGVEASKILMESRAGKKAMDRNRPELSAGASEPQWDGHLRRAIHVLRRIDLLSTPFGGEGSTQPGVNGKGKGKDGGNGNGKHVKPGEGETLANGASNLLGSMSRLAEMWSREGLGAASRSGAGSTQGPSRPNSTSQQHHQAGLNVEPGNAGMDNSSAGMMGSGPGSGSGGGMPPPSMTGAGPPPSAGLNMGGPDGYDDLANVLGVQQHHLHGHDHGHDHHSHPADQHHGQEPGSGHEHVHGHGHMHGHESHMDHHANSGNGYMYDPSSTSGSAPNSATASAFPHGPVLEHAHQQQHQHQLQQQQQMGQMSGDGQGRYDSDPHMQLHQQHEQQQQQQHQGHYPQSQGQGQAQGHEYGQGQGQIHAPHPHPQMDAESASSTRYYQATPTLGIQQMHGPPHSHGHGQAHSPHDYQSHQQQQQQQGYQSQHQPSEMPYGADSGAPTLHHAQQQQYQYPHNQQHPDPHGQHQHPMQSDAGPTPLDLLLGQMFNYATYAPVPAGAGGGGGAS